MRNISFIKNSVPIYLQLYERLKQDIVSGVYPFGKKLPSKRTAAADLGISTVTVEHAYTLLCDEGYIETRERSGYYVIFRSEDGFAHTRLPLSLEEEKTHTETYSTPSFPFNVFSKTVRKVLNCGEAAFADSPNKGCTELRGAISQYLAASRGIYTSPEQIIIGSGAEHLYGLIIKLFGDCIFALESPSYHKIELVYRANRVATELLTLTSDGIDSNALNSSGADILHVTPFRSFPSGVTASASKRHEYIRWADKEDRFIIEDDYESEFSVLKKPEETLYALSKRENVIYMNTFSQTISPSLRVAYMVLPPPLLPVWDEKLGFAACTVPTFEQLVLAELIKNGDFERHINRVRRKRRSEVTP